MKLYIFDFDGTISNKDSFILFTLNTLSPLKFSKYYVSILFLWFFKPKSKLKESFYHLFKDYESKKFNQICEDFEKKNLIKIIKSSFMKYISTIEEDSIKVVVSASISNYLKPWCDEMGFDLISTELEVKNGKLTVNSRCVH